LWEEGDKRPEGKSSWKMLKAKMKPSDASPRESRESNKGILGKKRGLIKKIKLKA
jgi:hypothetical protein